VSGEFAKIRDEYYRAWFRYHPEAALDVGVAGFEHLLRPYSDEEQGALLSLNEKLLGALEELDVSTLAPDDELDFRLMRGAAFLEIEQIMHYDWRKRDPEAFLPLRALHQLTLRKTNDFASALKQRLAAIPDYLLNARHYAGQDRERVPAQWLESAVVAVESGLVYLDGLKEDPKVKAHIEALSGLDALLAEASDAFRRYARFLEREIGGRASGEFAVGRKRFSHLLQYRHFLEISPDELHAFGSRLVAKTMHELERVCRGLGDGGEANLSAVTERLRGMAYGGDDLVAAYRDEMEAAREFVRSRDLASLPENESLKVEKTPVFLRHRIPFAAYDPPAPGDAPQTGRYYITPPADAETLALHSSLAMSHTSVHEGYPGHHLQFTTAHTRPAARSLPRMLNTSATLYEGWALYCEQLMLDSGFLDRPESALVMLRDRLWRALRIVLDVEMQTRGRDIQAAAGELTDRLGFPRTQAMGEATWYSRAPTVPMGYATGWAMIDAVRHILLEQGTVRSLKEFHDALLAHGSCALSLVLARAFGEEAAARAESRIRD
jgi:uncharacterized protein (DUF885 family)